jgi:hypothetical protein
VPTRHTLASALVCPGVCPNASNAHTGQHEVVRLAAARLQAGGLCRSRSIRARHLERQHSACATRRGSSSITNLPR